MNYYCNTKFMAILEAYNDRQKDIRGRDCRLPGSPNQ